MLRACVLATVVLLVGGCTPTQAATTPPPPPGEVWLTAAEVAQGGIAVEPFTKHGIDDVIVTSGRIALSEEHVSHVTSPVSGRVARIDGALGEHVEKGETLAVLRSPDLGDATSALAKATADFISNEHAFRRAKALNEEGAAADAAVEQARDAWRQSKAEVERAREKVALLHAGRGVTEVYPLTSPIAGTIFARNVTPGFEVQGAYSGGTQPELFTVGDTDEVWAYADGYEADLARIHAGQLVDVSVVSVPQPFREARLRRGHARSADAHGPAALHDCQPHACPRPGDVRDGPHPRGGD